MLRVQTENPLEGEIVQGRRYLMMPDLTGVHVDKARETLTEKGFTGEVKVTESDDPGCKPNIVCRTTPERQTRTEPSSTKLLYVGR